MLIIFWDHLHWFTGIGAPLHYGFSDAAAIFVFLSGYVVGIVYGKTYAMFGFKALLRKACRRASQIYVAHLAALGILFAIAVILPPVSGTSPINEFYDTCSENGVGIIARILTLQYFPMLFDILPLYIVLMLTVPVAIPLIYKEWKIFFIASFVLYVVSQIFPVLNIHTYLPVWSLDPVAWSFLFSSAMIIGVKRREGTLHIPVRLPYLTFVAFVVVYSFSDLSLVNDQLHDIGLLNKSMMFLFPSPFPFIEKSTLQPVYLLHFISLAYLVGSLVPYMRSVFAYGPCSLLTLCGQHSLALFSGGIVLTYFFAYIVIAGGGQPFVFYFLQLAGWTATVTAGYILSGRKKASSIARPKPLIPYNKIVKQ